MVSKDANTFTTREREIIGMMFQCLQEKPKVDYDKLAQLGGYKNKAACSASVGPILKKLAAGVATHSPAPDADGEGAAEETPAKKKGGGRKRKNDGEESPSKQATLKRCKKAQEVEAEAEPEEDGDDQAKGDGAGEEGDSLTVKGEAETEEMEA